MKEKKICSIIGCTNQVNANHLCKKHCYAYYKYGDPLYRVTESHGKTNSKEYKSWQDMKSRCYNIDNVYYSHYGGRGITVCDKWKYSFIAFYKDMGDKPFSKAQIDRIDNDGNYEFENCQWVSQSENNRKKSDTHLSMDKAREIRQLYSTLNINQRQLAYLYSVAPTLINNVVNNKTWKEVNSV